MLAGYLLLRAMAAVIPLERACRQSVALRAVVEKFMSPGKGSSVVVLSEGHGQIGQ
jgi:hypothetical protein